MEDLFSALNKASAAPRYLTVSQVTQKIKGLLEMEVGEVWIKAEISGYKPSPSGHVYFNLKDENSVINCALFKGAAMKSFGAKPRFNLHDGLEVIVHGRISVYAPRGNYQLIVDHVEPVGAGALQLAFQQLKEKLQKEGLFDPSRKKAIPAYPSRIAIVTSPTGAALQDMLNVLGRRNAGISVLVVPTLVQGDAAAAQIARAVEVVNRFELADVIVVARGGGSLEDLWCFNDELVVRAVADSGIPVISAVGHEVDFTLCDFAADLRAPTPSAAAELVSKNKLELLESLQITKRRLNVSMSASLSRARNALLALEGKLVSPGEKLIRTRKRLVELELRMMHLAEGLTNPYRQMVDESHARLVVSLDKLAVQRRRQLENLSGRLEALSPLKVLGRGYALVENAKTGKIMKSVGDAKPGTAVSLVFADGKAKAEIK